MTARASAFPKVAPRKALAWFGLIYASYMSSRRRFIQDSTFLFFRTKALRRLAPSEALKTSPPRARLPSQTRQARSSAPDRRRLAMRSRVRRRADRPEPSGPSTPAARLKPASRRRRSRRRGSRRRRAPRRAARSDRAPSLRRRICWPSRGRWDGFRPQRSRSIPATSPTKKTACGLPMFTTLAAPKRAQSSGRSTSRVSATGRASGISFHANRGGPMSTRQVQGPSRSHAISPADVSRVNESAPVCRARRSATQRVPLPQAPARLPSLL
jgi:hypothetical protein